MTDLAEVYPPRRDLRPLADLPYRPSASTSTIRSPRLTWSDTSSKSDRPAKDFESCETVGITESAQCSLAQRLAQFVNHESTRMDTNPKSSSGERVCLACWLRWPRRNELCKAYGSP